jgi:hypothetical protein
MRIRSLVMFAAALIALPAGTRAFADATKSPAAKPDKPPAAQPDKPAAKPGDKPAAAKPGDKPTKPADDAKDTVSDKDADRFLQFFDKLAVIVIANRTDCNKMARRINAHVDANAGLLKDIEAAKQANKQIPPAVKEKISKKYADEVEPAMKERCAGDKQVMEALVRIHPAPARPAAAPAK